MAYMDGKSWRGLVVQRLLVKGCKVCAKSHGEMSNEQMLSIYFGEYLKSSGI